ncbi:NADH dehydrogenase (quinone) subunit D [Aliarcobacter cibarius]|jgi:NADH-quinone oxidoreductase subunit D|uniref:NADH-quinone oxidoreductase subunit D n=1 Tax=Aliarcobacter cibarius TaxID=255507 RepID=A0A7L5JMH9_9BACT|nr:NADH dehydrogenase (quinone) subunit D [Aliarcobacter cibarius]QKJ26330.1 NADH:quinone oxidoreductase I, chain D [Aliarcobacter cibarius]TLT01821.1 NADH dehydrogenase (quinone) subunit D [Aliarcobacter cibarius]TLT02156.1 NADH dehydrogenase (quinone) subunit D [Aliarcobacter cibarius]TLT04569.1 NADH dehydrogenase (quinone) subunit D [Aliarcobacter cibarius]
MQTANRLKPFFENIHFQREDNTMTVNFGPQHPSAHGQLRLVLELQGEEVVKARPMIGYLHRGMEKMAENMIYNEFLPTTDRMDYIAATSNNYAYAKAVEELLGLEVPRRAECIRVILLELNRVVSHLFWLATHALDVGAMSMFLYCFREREYALDLIEDYCGARLTHSAIRIGGVPLDLPENWIENCAKFLNNLKKEIDNYEKLLNENRIWRMRLENVGVITPQMAKDFAVSGVALRGSGIKWDLRKEMPYSIYNELEFDVPISNSCDSYGRYRLCIEEMKESIKIIEQVFPKYYESDTQLMSNNPLYVSPTKEDIMTQNYSLMQHFVLVTQGFKPPVGEVYVATESPKGELGFYIKSDGKEYPYRLKVRAPSYFHTALLEELLVGCQLADVVTIIGNLNIVFGEIDR